MSEGGVICVVCARNEEETIARCLRSILAQSPKVDLCVVDDGSYDHTVWRVREVEEKAGRRVHLLYFTIKRFTASGFNQAIAFNHGVAHMSRRHPGWRFLLKVDADTVLPPDYLSRLLSRMERDPRLGICGGQPHNERIRLRRVTDSGRLIRRECWQKIGGYDILIAFDSHALLKANQAGWKTRTFDDVRYHELRESGKYNIRQTILRSFERKKCYLPLYHTFCAAVKNIRSGPPIINSLFLVLSHLLYPAKNHAPFLTRDFVRRYAALEVREFLRLVTRS